ncbi:hypothetical protein [Synechocystis sp. CACIAM 05]|uniref:hypothetical protein n=1 Tax=Synechocystis sp. CACIAM 05 TaxID=1933929 RepID=UPI00138E6A16|nr:hypothetical protein [Synechocystis sp. CACIAM 05]QHU99574.1 hypothetical protein BWK47_05145 [Synechocystis sp. CACIAM 05]
MPQAYEQSSYLAAPYSFEAVKNSTTEQIRPLTGVQSFYQFTGGVMDANETLAWTMPAAVLIESFWVAYPGSPGGTVTITLFDTLNVQNQNLIINTNNNGEKFDNAWAYSFSAPFAIPQGWSVRFKPSAAISSVIALGEPCLFFDNQFGVRVT